MRLTNIDTIMNFDQEGWIAKYVERSAYWFHDGNPSRPHVRMRSGRHSNGFFNSRPVIDETALLRKAVEDLVDLLQLARFDINNIDRVVGPQTGATRLADHIAETIGRIRRRKCAWASPEKGEAKEGVPGPMKFADPMRSPRSGEMTILCEDVMTTGGSAQRAAIAVKDKGGILLPYVLVLVNRSGQTEIDGRKIIALINTPMDAWQPESCPLCDAGSPLLVNVKDEWSRLTADYQPA
jgi:orotate phosphoribosyltransferase